MNYNRKELINTNIQNLIIAKEFDQAIEILEDILRFHQDRYKMELLLTLLDSKISNYNKIIQYIFEAENYYNLNSSQLAYIKLFHSKLLLEHYKYDEARKELEKLRNFKDIKNQIVDLSYLEEGILERTLNNHSKAETLLKNCLKTHAKDAALLELGLLYKLNDDYTKALNHLHQSKPTLVREMAILNLYIKYEKYQEAYNLIKDSNLSVPSILVFLKSKLNMKIKPNALDDKFISRNLLNYNNDECFDHILTHANESNIKTLHSVFNKNFNINEKFNEYKEKVKTITPFDETFTRYYLIEENNIIGDCDTFESKYVKVITDFNNNILTMYPVLSHYEHDSNKFNNAIDNFNNFVNMKKQKNNSYYKKRH